MFWKDFIRDYLTFGKRDRIGVIAILIMIGFIYALPHIFKPKPDPNFIKELPYLAKGIDSQNNSNGIPNKDVSKGINPSSVRKQALYTEKELFTFDPNTISLEGWRKLGLNENTAKIIINYRNKGGKFYKPDDLMRIWTLPVGFYERVKDFIKCESVKPHFDSYPVAYNNKSSKKEISIVEINGADSNAFVQLPGIGTRLAQRIINFRNKLGGFYSIEQIGETYGLPDSTFKRIKNYLKADADVKKIPLNECTKEDLKAHPYIKWPLANAIIEYRTQHGPYKNMQELKNIVLINDSVFSKIAPYLSL
ncbi:MAG TPA: helix-hairpin-helix domain-containing protein [Flavisolibacter sp.]|nr:helix-hairpin-helix domain-containing protein [Flavisolibacter sp.]